MGSKIAGATLSSNSLRQTVYTHCISVHQAAKLVAALLRVARVTAGLAESNGSLPPGLWLVTCRLTTKNRDQLRNHTFGNRVLATFTFLLLIIYVRALSQKKTICNPLAHPTWKCTTLTCEMPNFFYLTEGLHSTCIFRTCVFHPCRFVPAFSVLAFSSTCIFSAPAQPTVSKHWRLSAILMASNVTETNSEKIVTEIRRTRLCCNA